MTSATEIFVSDSDWQVANSAYLDLQFSRVRLLLEMYKSWLRARWTGKPPDLDPLDAMVIREEVVDRCGNGQQWEERDSFFARDPTAQELAARLAEIESDLEARSHSMASAGRPAALDLLCSYFDLNEFERALLLLCAAVEEDASFARVCAYLHDDVSMRYPTPALTLALFCPSAARAQAARQSFLPTSPLRRYGLVTFASGMRTDDRVLQYLRGFNTADERVADLLRPIPAFPAVSHQHTLAAKLEAALRGPDGRKRWHGVNLFGPQGCGRRALARILCDRLSLHLYRLDVARLPAPGQERQSILRLLAREAILAQIAVYVDVGEEDPAGRDAESADDLIERMPVFFIAATRMRLSSSRPILPVSLPRIDGAQRRQLWDGALCSAGLSLRGPLEPVVEQFQFPAEMITQAVKVTRVRARLRNSGDETVISADELWEACREQTCWKQTHLARPVTPVYVWDDIVLSEQPMHQLREIASQVRQRARVYNDWGFNRKLARGRGVSALFAGVSGTGKTMAAEVLASDLRLDLYRIDLAGVVSKYIGETEKNLRTIFDSAERSGAILFFDEADALFGRRTDVKDSHDRFANIEVNYLLQRMEEYRGLSILATNRKTEVDRAFLRRLRFLVDFPFPDPGHRLLIWRKVFPPETPLGNLDYEFLSRMELAGGNIRNIALAAAFLAAESGERVEMSHLIHAARREYAKIDKMISDAEFNRQNSHVVRKGI